MAARCLIAFYPPYSRYTATGQHGCTKSRIYTWLSITGSCPVITHRHPVIAEDLRQGGGYVRTVSKQNCSPSYQLVHTAL
ncbi:unnamed protein product [Staurois parvus]|uniref:Uncharacterized protein n=1 Tax=Staurois parvus TaxID=386267 RepID=A0ABN9B9R0_9NEOB|nr:unnamed protein product [Staurois parvus]